MYASTAVSTNHICVCPNCGCSHATNSTEYVLTVVSDRLYRDELEDFRMQMAQIQYEAVRRSRELSTSDSWWRSRHAQLEILPVDVRRSPTLQFSMRCPGRRPRMSLLQRVKQHQRFCKTRRNLG